MTFHKLKTKYSRLFTVLFILATSLLNMTCFTVKYDFKGGIKIDPRVKTFSVQYFDNRAQRIEPTLSQRVTDGLKDYIESNTNLKLVTTYGDVDFSGVITDYKINSTSYTAGDIAAQTKFTITIKVTYSNLYVPDDDFEESFSKSIEFESTKDISSVELEYSEDLVDEIIELIFNKAFINW